MSAFQGDYIEQAPRRAFVQQLAESQPVYSYCASPLLVAMLSLTTDFWSSDRDVDYAVSWINQVDGIGAVRILLPDQFQQHS